MVVAEGFRGGGSGQRTQTFSYMMNKLWGSNKPATVMTIVVNNTVLHT